MPGVCAHDCECVNVSGSVYDACAWGWLCTVAVAVVIVVAAVAAAGGEDEDEACARCSRHGAPLLGRSSMISSSPSSTTHHPPAKKSKCRVLAVSARPKESRSETAARRTGKLLKVALGC